MGISYLCNRLSYIYWRCVGFPVITDLQSAVLPHTLVNCCSIGHSIIPSGFTQPVYKNEQPTLSVGTGTLVPKTIKYGHLYSYAFDALRTE